MMTDKDYFVIVKHAFKYVDTYGLPLETVVEVLHKHGFLIDWDQFMIDAKLSGWKTSTIYNKIKEARDDCR